MLYLKIHTASFKEYKHVAILYQYWRKAKVNQQDSVDEKQNLYDKFRQK